MSRRKRRPRTMARRLAEIELDPGGRFRIMSPLQHERYRDLERRCGEVLTEGERRWIDERVRTQVVPVVMAARVTTDHDRPRQGRIDWYELWDRTLLKLGVAMLALVSGPHALVAVFWARTGRSVDRSQGRARPPILRRPRPLPPLGEAIVDQQDWVIRAARLWLMASLAGPRLPGLDRWELQRAWETAWVASDRPIWHP